MAKKKKTMGAGVGGAGVLLGILKRLLPLGEKSINFLKNF